MDVTSASRTAQRSEKERPYLDRATPATSPRNHTHVLVHWESCLQGSEIPAAEPARADSDIRARTTITVVPQNPKPGPKSKGWRQKSKPRRRSVASRRRPSPSEPGEIAVDSDSTAGKASRPKQNLKALSPVPSLRRRDQGRDSRRLRGKLAVQCCERRQSRQGRVKHEQLYQAHA